MIGGGLSLGTYRDMPDSNVLSASHVNFSIGTTKGVVNLKPNVEFGIQYFMRAGDLSHQKELKIKN